MSVTSTKPVLSSAALTASGDSAGSTASGAGFSPRMSRIHAAWRASTETIRSTALSASPLRFGTWTL